MMLPKMLWVLLLSACCVGVTLQAQPAASNTESQETFVQRLFCTPNIVWAGELELDLVPDAPAGQNWDLLNESGLSNLNFKQSDSTLIENDTLLASYLLDAMVSSLSVYKTDSLRQAIHSSDLDIFDSSNDVKEDFPVLSPKNFEVLRIKCYVYYDKGAATFRLHPTAAALIRTEYDGPNSKAFYQVVGWISISESVEPSLDWQKLMHRDVDMREAFVLKQAWTLEQCMDQLTDLAYRQPTPQKRYAPNALNQPTLLSEEALKNTVTEIIMEDIDPETYEITETEEKASSMSTIGMTFSLRLGWDNNNKTLYAAPIGYAPIRSNMDILCEGKWCKGENMFLERIFYVLYW